MDPTLVSFAVLILVGIVLLAPFVMARRRAPQERGLTPSFETFCPFSFGSFGGANIPMVRLSIYPDFIVIALLAPRVIPITQLARVEVVGGRLRSRRLCLTTKRGGSYHLFVKGPDDVAKMLGHI